MELTERLLNDAGGWQTMKQAKALHEIGRVLEASWAEPLLQGRVREGETDYRSGLKILSKSNVENLCACRQSRQYGAICAHSVAVGLEILKPRVKIPPPVPSTPVAAAAPVDPGYRPAFSLELGEAIELHVVLPPNMSTAWLKNGVTVGFEVERAGRRSLLPTLDKNVAYRCSPEDLRAIAALRKMTGGELAGMASLPREKFLDLLEALEGHPRVTFGKSALVSVGVDPLRPQLEITRKPDGSLRLHAVLPADTQPLLGTGRAWVLQERAFRSVAPGLPAPYTDLLTREIVLPAEHAISFVSRELPGLQKFFEFEMPEWAVPETPAQPTALRFLLQLEGSLNHLTAKLSARYGIHVVTLASTPARTQHARDGAAEKAAIERLQVSGFSGPDAQGVLVLKGEPRILSFFARDLPAWERDAEVEIGERFGHVTANVERVQPRMEVRSSGENWFELQFELGTGSGDRFSAAEIQRLLQSGQSHVRRANGKVAVFDPAILDEFQQVLQDCDPQQRQPGLYRIEQRHASYIQAMATEHGTPLKAPNQWITFATAGRNLESLQQVPLGSLEDVLRPYQKQGVYWMNFLARNGLGGILADEMGLGKTVQTLAFLRELGGRALIVCPSSLTFNWAREAARFTPDRKVLLIEGTDRQGLIRRDLPTADLAITSYPLLRRDVDFYRDADFTTVVLDEAQHIKNPDSQNAQAACSVRARHRFALTGTPVENSVRDLWSLMHFLMPGYLGSRQDFKDRFERSISEAPTGPEQQRLVKRIRPFVLRRTKKAVITELPDKIEQVSYCEMSQSQRELYTELLGTARRQISELSGDKDQKKARMVMLTALLRLRQICCDPRLVGTEMAEEDSAKLELLNELLEETVDGGHRVLIFSQFVGMLHLLRDRLIAAGIDYCYLDGSTKDRTAQVDRFQTGTVPVFLISLKAGGTGLNLTAADTVIIYEPWWNPAVEAQAADRAHRIGQLKVVTTYRLITRNSVEEKILSLQQRKQEVTDATIESEEPMMTGLTLRDIESLLE